MWSTAGCTMPSTDRARPIVDLRPIAQPARRPQLAERGRRLRRRRARSASTPRERAAGLAALRRASPIAWSRSATLDGVQFVNDSKATNPDAAARALASFERIYWIAGGRPKEGGLDAAAALARSGPPRLPDRRGGGAASSRRSRPARPVHAQRRSRDRGRQAAAAAWADRSRRPRRPAGAGLRVVRPVPRFRGARRAFKALVGALRAAPERPRAPRR